jgi:hypothetical protein
MGSSAGGSGAPRAKRSLCATSRIVCRSALLKRRCKKRFSQGIDLSFGFVQPLPQAFVFIAQSRQLGTFGIRRPATYQRVAPGALLAPVRKQ